MHISCYLIASVVVAAPSQSRSAVYLPTSQQAEVSWKFTESRPPDDWTEPSFDDTAWKSGRGPFGRGKVPFVQVFHTNWSTSDLWLRRKFTLDAVPDQDLIALNIFHDEDAEVYLNGERVAALKGFARSYRQVPLAADSLKQFRKGRNVLAVHVRQTRGGQGIDVGLQTYDPQNAVVSQSAADGRPNRAAEPGVFEMLTPWGEQVTADNAWREYPRPQCKRARWMCLNGLWEFAIIGDAGRWQEGRVENASFDPLLGELPSQPTEWPHKILVPFSPETQLSGVVKSVRPNQIMWYRRAFQVPQEWSGQRVLLHFEAVDWHAIVLLNGHKVGDNRGGYVPFSCDLTEALTADGPQQLVVVVWDPTNMGDQTIGKQALPELRRGFRYTPNSGIWQSVWLEPVPTPAYIQNLKITPVAQRRAIDVTINVLGKAQDLTVRASAGRNSPTTNIPVGKAGEPLRLELDDSYQLWSPDNPTLHDLTIELRRGEEVIDTIRSYFALRTIDIAPDASGNNRIRLNGQPIFQFGPLDQGYWPDGALTPPSEEAVRYDLQYLKDIGCNMVRVHIKMHPRRWYYEADRLGLLVWQDFVCGRKFDSKITPASAKQWELEQRRMIDHLRNHPSIVMWIVFNEGWGQYDTERLTQWAKGYDPSRLVSCASGWTDFPVGDIYDNHDYSFNISPAHAANFAERATLCGECGGFNVLLEGHLWHANQTQQARVNPNGETGRENYESVAQWEPRYRTWLTNLRLMQSGGLNAAVYTQISDVEHECNGWLTYDRRLSKFPIERLRRWHDELYKPIRSQMLFGLADGNAIHHVGDVPTDWANTRFAASDWSKTPAPGDQAQQPTLQFRSEEGPLHLRGQLTLPVVPKRIAMHTVGSADRWELFLNGESAMDIRNSDRAGYVPYSTVLLPAAAIAQLRQGENTIALKLTAAKNQSRSLVDFALLVVGD